MNEGPLQPRQHGATWVRLSLGAWRQSRKVTRDVTTLKHGLGRGCLEATWAQSLDGGLHSSASERKIF